MIIDNRTIILVLVIFTRVIHSINSNDEESACQKEEWQCNNSQCINKRNLCDGFHDCNDTSDEHNCLTCLPHQFRCASGQCTSKSRRCGRYGECRDKSDQENCRIQFEPQKFAVKFKRCLNTLHTSSKVLGCIQAARQVSLTELYVFVGQEVLFQLTPGDLPQ
ncbi:hypothetical protein Btru_073098 [Bulinus truncatus]|nr:hypothetical protein Btru_073098 [Bulinus truncatus]